MSKRKKLLIKTIIIIFIVFIITILLWIMPGRVKRYFPHYSFFKAATRFTIYPNELPKSAHNVKYYTFTYFTIDKSGYRAAFSQEDYELHQTRRWEKYNVKFAGEHYLYDRENKKYLDRDEMSQRGANFLDELLPPEEDDGQYYFLAYEMCDGGSLYTYSGVLCNDEKREIIEFTYRLCSS